MQLTTLYTTPRSFCFIVGVKKDYSLEKHKLVFLQGPKTKPPMFPALNLLFLFSCINYVFWNP